MWRFQDTSEQVRPPVVGEFAERALGRATERLLAEQDAAGFWCGELEGDSILQSEYILLKFIVGQEDDPRLEKIGNYLRLQQRDDGAWVQYPGAKPDLSDHRAGLLFVRIAYSDGSKGVLVVSCHLNGGPDFVARPAAPASIFEGITASKGYTDYWNRVPPIAAVDGNRTLFHILSQEEKHD